MCATPLAWGLAQLYTQSTVMPIKVYRQQCYPTTQEPAKGLSSHLE